MAGIALFTAALNFFSYFTIVSSLSLLDQSSIHPQSPELLPDDRQDHWVEMEATRHPLQLSLLDRLLLLELRLHQEHNPELIFGFFPSAPPLFANSSFWAVCLMEALIFPMSLL